tara:strand:- start:760 stop:1200 length:441 start_codon:yes stop_codon:yes gene_type:complete
MQLNHTDWKNIPIRGSYFSSAHLTPIQKERIKYYIELHQYNSNYSINQHLYTLLKKYFNKKFIYIDEFNKYCNKVINYINNNNIKNNNTNNNTKSNLFGIIYYGACPETDYNKKICICIYNNECSSLSTKLICQRIIWLIDNNIID